MVQLACQNLFVAAGAFRLQRRRVREGAGGCFGRGAVLGDLAEVLLLVAHAAGGGADLVGLGDGIMAIDANLVSRPGQAALFDLSVAVCAGDSVIFDMQGMAEDKGVFVLFVASSQDQDQTGCDADE